MQQYLTLEEAASRLRMPADELREMAKTKKIRAFQDRGSWRFRAQDIEELGRTRGLGSDPEVQLADPPSPKPSKAKPPADEELLAIDFSLDKPASGSGKSGPKSPGRKAAADSDVRLVMDSNLDFQIDLDSDVRLEQSPQPPKRKSKLQPGDSGARLVGEKPSDSDVKVVPAATDSDVKPRPTKSPSDSDIRLQDSGRRKKSAEDHIVTEEVIDLDAEESKLKQRSGEIKKPRVTQTASNPVLPTTSPFELSEPNMDLDTPKPPKGRKSPAKPASDKDSSSDFELVPFDQSKSPVDLGSGEIPMLVGDEDVDLGELKPGTGNSGINIQDPADSGISLEEEGSAEVEFELSLDSGVSPKTPKPAKPLAEEMDDDSSSEFELSLDDAPSDPSSSEFELSLDDSGDSFDLKDDSGSDSEFELTLDDDGGLSVEDEAQDIFEPTNFDVPALDDESGSEAVAIDESDTDLDGSDFELSLDEDSSTGSKSQVVALDDEEEADTGAATVAKPRAKAKKRAAAAVVESDEGMELNLDLEDSAPKQKPKKGAVATDEEDDEEDERTIVPAAPVEWGAMPAIILFPTVIVLFLVGIMAFELVQGMWSYQRPGSRASNTLIHPIAKPIAEAMDAKLPD